MRPVEAVNLVNEQERPLPGFAAHPRRVEDFLQIGNAGEDRRDLLEMQIGGASKQPRHRGLTGARRPPKDERTKRARLQHAGERAVGAEQMILPDHVGQLVRPKLIGERPRRVAFKARGSEQSRRAFLRARAHSSTERGRYLLTAPIDDNAPQSAAGAHGTIKIGGFLNLLIVDRKHNIAALQADRLRR